MSLSKPNLIFLENEYINRPDKKNEWRFRNHRYKFT